MLFSSLQWKTRRWRTVIFRYGRRVALSLIVFARSTQASGLISNIAPRTARIIDTPITGAFHVQVSGQFEKMTPVMPKSMSTPPTMRRMMVCRSMTISSTGLKLRFSFHPNPTPCPPVCLEAFGLQILNRFAGRF